MSVKTQYVLHHLNRGLRLELSQLRALGVELDHLVADARAQGEKLPVDLDLRERWDRQWKCVQLDLHQIREDVSEMRDALDADVSGAEDARSLAERWEKLQSMARGFDRALADLEEIATDHLETDDEIWEIINMHIGVIRSHASAVRLEMEVRKRFTREQVSSTDAELLGDLPHDASLEDAEHYAEDYKRAISELTDEKHRFGGFLDGLKALFVYQESPRERAAKIHAPKN